MWEWIKGLFDMLLRHLKSFLRNVSKVLIKNGAKYILQVARETVEELAKTDLTNEQKRKEAFEEIKSFTKTKGLQIRDSVINTVIELAYLEYKDAIGG